LDEIFPRLLTELVADGSPVWDDGELSKLCLSFGGHQMSATSDPRVDARILTPFDRLSAVTVIFSANYASR
jgi:hypothetical protein